TRCWAQNLMRSWRGNWGAASRRSKPAAKRFAWEASRRHRDDLSPEGWPMTPKRYSRKGAAWTLKEVRQLGKVPDSALARRSGRTIKQVVAERHARGVNIETGPRRWTANEIKLLGKLNDHEVARRLRRTPVVVR